MKFSIILLLGDSKLRLTYYKLRFTGWDAKDVSVSRVVL